MAATGAPVTPSVGLTVYHKRTSSLQSRTINNPWSQISKGLTQTCVGNMFPTGEGVFDCTYSIFTYILCVILRLTRAWEDVRT